MTEPRRSIRRPFSSLTFSPLLSFSLFLSPLTQVPLSSLLPLLPHARALSLSLIQVILFGYEPPFSSACDNQAIRAGRSKADEFEFGGGCLWARRMAPGCPASSVVQPRQASAAVLQGRGVRRPSAGSAFRARCRCGACLGPRPRISSGESWLSRFFGQGRRSRDRSRLRADSLLRGPTMRGRGPKASFRRSGPRGEQVRPQVRLFPLGPRLLSRDQRRCGLRHPARDGSDRRWTVDLPAAPTWLPGVSANGGGPRSLHRCSAHPLRSRGTAVQGSTFGYTGPSRGFRTVERALGCFHVLPRRPGEGNGDPPGVRDRSRTTGRRP
ncbi:hypothetical protein V8E36_009206 [Tilletia maclaganii]